MPTPPEPGELRKLRGKTRTVSELLAIFNEHVRDQAVVVVIRVALEAEGLTTVPSFATARHDEELHFVTPADAGEETAAAEEPPNSVPGAKSTRVEVLETASAGLVSVQPGTPIDYATTLMMSRRLAQLPVLEGESVLRGVVTWRSIWAMRARGDGGSVVEDALDDDISIVHASDRLFTALDRVAEQGYALVRASDGTLSGLINYADIVKHFGMFAAPFFAIGDIERRLRTCVERNFVEADIPAGFRQKEFARFTLGSYWHFFKIDQNWHKLGWQGCSQETFLALLDRVINVRNEVMHFNPSLMTTEKQQRLEEFAGMLRQLVP